ncbi:MAG: hypothetical protein RI572_03735 [Salegentibacter sp.]|uniref:DUF6702 family protein n=1 Tax=Salegentibacter sp. TaxID=1903072 RepID=UPI00287031A3|nr:DUF6702 family protein [Salegentibacter sp.]MDR9456501.1 hypothetical protein [Salegentibacter sp.]
MKKIFILFGLFFILTSFKVAAHEYYLSVTEINYKTESQSLQIITRVFVDDFENVLRKRFNNDIRLVKDAEEGPVRKMIERYLRQKLQLKSNGKKHQLKYLGKEYDNDQMILYIEVEKVAPFTEISITNSILTDLFDDQKNVVHVKVNGVTKSLLFQKNEDKKSFKFRN